MTAPTAPRSTTPLLLVGAGGLARETVEVVRAINAQRPTWELLGFLDDNPGLHGATVDGTPVLGGIDLAGAHPSAKVAVCTASPTTYDSRHRLTRRLALPDTRYATLVHPAATVATTATVGIGSVVLAGVVMTAAVTVGRHVVVMPGVVLTHDDRLDDYVTVAAGARLAGGVHVEQGAYIGAGALIRERLTIGAWSLVGMGAAVTKPVPPGEIWAGTPATFWRRATVAPHDQEMSA